MEIKRSGEWGMGDYTKPEALNLNETTDHIIISLLEIVVEIWQMPLFYITITVYRER